MEDLQLFMTVEKVSVNLPVPDASFHFSMPTGTKVRQLNADE